MRTFILFLTFLFTLQPASWAAVNTEATVPIQIRHAVQSNPDVMPADYMQRASGGCIVQMDKAGSDAPGCQSMCMSYCGSANALPISITEIHQSRIFQTHFSIPVRVFISIIESPETQPPQRT